MARKKTSKSVETLTHEEAKRKNIPTAEHQSVMHKEEQAPARVTYEPYRQQHYAKAPG